MSQGSQDSQGSIYDPPTPISYSPTLYTVDPRVKTITKNSVPAIKKSYKDTEHEEFFDKTLRDEAGGGIQDESTHYLIKEKMRDLFPARLKQVHTIFDDHLETQKGASRRRRPSRKYKKSKRVLRRKSRSTRRR